MGDKVSELANEILMEYTKDDWVKIIDCINNYIRDSERDVKRFKRRLKQQGASEYMAERECIWRSALLGLITREEAKRRMSSH
jgi:hypothetical protein